MRFATSFAEREDGTVIASTFAASTFKPLTAERYSGYSVLTPPRVGSSGSQLSSRRNSPIALFWPGRKCGTQWRSPPPFWPVEEPLHVSMGGPAIGSYVDVIESTYGWSR